MRAASPLFERDRILMPATWRRRRRFAPWRSPATTRRWHSKPRSFSTCEQGRERARPRHLTGDPVDYPDTAAAAAVAGRARRGGRGDRDRRRRHRIGHRGEQDAGCPRRDVPQRDARALCARAQRRQRARARRDARQRRTQALAIVDTFLDTPMREARYIRRLAKIRDLERRPRD